MSSRKIPHDAFEFYFSLGPERSYEKVAPRYGVTKRAVTKIAAREDWQKRLEKVEAEARDKTLTRSATTYAGDWAFRRASRSCR